MQVDGVELTQEHIGQPMIYTPKGSNGVKRQEQGWLSSFLLDGNSRPAIFVQFPGTTGQRCPPESLTWGLISAETDKR